VACFAAPLYPLYSVFAALCLVSGLSALFALVGYLPKSKLFVLYLVNRDI
jgi:hypothetical protein